VPIGGHTRPLTLQPNLLNKQRAVNDENAHPDSMIVSRGGNSAPLLKAGLSITNGSSINGAVQQQPSVAVYHDENMPPRAVRSTRSRIGSGVITAAHMPAVSVSVLPAAPGGPIAPAQSIRRPLAPVNINSIINLPHAASNTAVAPIARIPSMLASGGAASLQLPSSLSATATQLPVPDCFTTSENATAVECVSPSVQAMEAAPISESVDVVIQSSTVDTDICQTNNGIESADATAATSSVNVMDCNTSDAMDLCSSPPADTFSSSEESTSASLLPNIPASLPIRSDILYGGDYVDEITQHMFDSELTHVARADYMSVQPDLNGKMREILVDWLEEVSSRFRLQSETLFLAVSLLDRFLSLRAVHRRKLQLVGCVALMLAAKYEEIWIPEIKDFLTISDDAYQREHILHMEGVMLNTLKFQLTQVSSLRFLQRFMKHSSVGWMAPYASAQDECAHHLCMYLLEITLQFVDFLQFKHSTHAAAVLFLVRAHCHAVLAQVNSSHTGVAAMDAVSLANEAWCMELEKDTRHSARDVQPCAQLLYFHWNSLSVAGAAALQASNAQQQQQSQPQQPQPQPPARCLAVYRKYTKERFANVSQIKLLPPPKME
jgi:hypothetical protein